MASNVNYEHKTIKGKQFIKVAWDNPDAKYSANFVPISSIKFNEDDVLQAGTSVRVKYGKTLWTGTIESRQCPIKRSRPASDFVEGKLHLIAFSMPIVYSV